MPQLKAALSGGGGAAWNAAEAAAGSPAPLSFDFNTVVARGLKVLVPLSSSGRAACALPPPGLPAGACLLVYVPTAVVWNSLKGNSKAQDWDTDTPFERMEIVVCGGEGGAGAQAPAPAPPPFMTLALTLPVDFVRTQATSYSTLVAGMHPLPPDLCPYMDASESHRTYAADCSDAFAEAPSMGTAPSPQPRMAQPLSLGAVLGSMGSVRVTMENPLSGTNLHTSLTQSWVDLRLGLDTLHLLAPSMDQLNSMNALKTSNFAEPTPFNTFTLPPRPRATSIFEMCATPPHAGGGSRFPPLPPLFSTDAGGPGSALADAALLPPSIGSLLFAMAQRGGRGAGEGGGAPSEERCGELRITLRDKAFPPYHSEPVGGHASALPALRQPPLPPLQQPPRALAAGAEVAAERFEGEGLELLIKCLLLPSTERALKLGSAAPPSSLPNLGRIHRLKGHLERMRVGTLTSLHARKCVEDIELASGERGSAFLKASVASTGVEEALASATAVLLHVSSALDAACAAPAGGSGGGGGGFDTSAQNLKAQSRGNFAPGAAGKDLLPVVAAYLRAIGRAIADEKAAAVVAGGAPALEAGSVPDAAGAVAALEPPSPEADLAALWEGGTHGLMPDSAARHHEPSATLPLHQRQAATLAALKVATEANYLLPLLEGAHLCFGLAMGSALFALTLLVFLAA